MSRTDVKILIVDDMVKDRHLLEILLTSLGYNFISVSSGRKAIEATKIHDFSIILMDIIMPLMDGIEAAKKIRTNESTKSIPIIFISSLSAPTTQILSDYNPKTIDYIEKPFKADVLKASLDKFLITDNCTKEKCAYIACRSKLFSKTFSKSCKEYGLKPILMSSEKKILEDLCECKPSLIFIHDKIVADSGQKIVDEIKANEIFSDSYLVIASAEKSGGRTADTLEADFFLPIPFLKNQVAAIFRQVLNLPKKVVFVSPDKESIQSGYDALKQLKYDVKWVESGHDAQECLLDFFPDIIYSKYKLSDMNGAKLCITVKDKPIFRYMFFLIETNNNSSNVISECFNAGADDIILSKRNHDEKLKLITSLVSSPSQGRKNNVLLIEKSNTVKGKVARLLRRHNYNVTSTSIIDAAKDKVTNETFDVVIVSYNLALEDNWEFCIDLMSNKATKNTPLVMLCSKSHSDDVKKLGNLLSISDVVYTPFNNEEFTDAVQLVVEEAQSQLEKTELAKYVPLDAVKHVGDVVSGIKDTKAEEKFISILFSDICSFTSKCEEMNASSMVALLNSFFDLMTDVIRRNNGIVDKFIGDAIVARFDTGNPKNDATNAANAAIDMFSSLESWNTAYIEPFQIRIGINSGDVVLGNIGSSTHLRNYTMIGDNVNIAQRLESEAPVQGCYIAEATRDLLDESVDVGELKYINVKGKKIPVGICRLIID